MYTILPDLEKNLYREFGAKRRFAQGAYSIFLSNQFSKDQLIEFVGERYKGVYTIITSGTIKKCKSVMENHKLSVKRGEVEISTLL